MLDPEKRDDDELDGCEVDFTTEDAIFKDEDALPVRILDEEEPPRTEAQWEHDDAV